MTREAIERRIEDLKKSRENLISNVNAVTGAIQDCEFWLGQVNNEASHQTNIGTNFQEASR
jgi:prefoldin subunit 5